MIKGIPVSKGYAIAKVFKFEKVKIDTQTKLISDPELEIKHYHQAIAQTKENILKLKEKSLERFTEETSKIFDAHLMIAEDPEIISSVEALIRSEKCNLTYALNKVVDRFLSLFKDLDNQYLRERAIDLKDVTYHILSFALDIKGQDLSVIDEDVILVCEDLTPSEMTHVNTTYIKGIVMEQGGMTSHSAIIARLLGIPAIAGVKDIFNKLKNGDDVIVDGFSGRLFYHFDDKTRLSYLEKRETYLNHLASLDIFIGKPSETSDHVQTHLYANIGSPKDIDLAIKHDAEGIGLFRTELLYMDSHQLPSEEEQFQAYRLVLERMNPKPVTIRTLDIGGDKFLSYLSFDHELNPFLGKRAVRLSLAHPEVFKTQIRALLRASVYGQLSIMVPMISTKEEILLIKKMISEVKEDLMNNDIFVSNYKLGIMIEVPSAVMIADALAKEVDFFSIGTNDLIQYVFAADRTNEALNQFYQPLHPSILKMIKIVVDAAKRANIEVSVCGEMAGHLTQGSLLLGLGIDHLSMTPSEILRMRKHLSFQSYHYLEQAAQSVLKYESEEQVQKELKKWIKNEGVS
ncbi:MAG: phosphoenolpyruvate--protein phosphotransferase [Acholeplasmataceae bacterium]|jgi:phosphotransferase system enzyme I (PtsI)|nr:phosphoenolpyruvate--protein phosphotransferase [Acholeplasmataceae bacterium]